MVLTTTPKTTTTTTSLAPLGCDTFVAYPPTAPAGTVVFGKNSDRPVGEGQSIRRYPAATYEPGSKVKCTYLEIPQASQTHAVLLSQIDWMWGAEHGINEHGVAIGNEAVWTNVSDDLSKRLLLGMDLLRLGLERGATAHDAMGVITNLLKTHGQGGPCAKNDPSFTYHNSFLIADSKEAWIVETVGRHWVAQRHTVAARNISNGLTIRTQFDLSSQGLLEYAKKHKLWNGQDPFDFAQCFASGGPDDSPYSRQACGGRLLKQHEGKHSLNPQAMMAILRDDDSGICMHSSGFETTASMVCEWNVRKDGNKVQNCWMLNQPHPCRFDYVLQPVTVAQDNDNKEAQC